MEKTEVPPRVAAIPHALVLNKPQNNRLAEEEYAHGECIIVPSVQKKKVQKTGIVTEKRTSRGPTTPKTLNTPKPMTFLIDFPNRANQRRNGMPRLNVLMRKYNFRLLF